MPEKAKKKILVLDDEAIVLQSVKFMLQGTQFEVHTAFNGDAALELIEQNSFDIVLFDYHMPGKNGIEFITAVKQKNRGMRMILITGDADRNILDESFNHGAHAYLLKPFEKEDLLRILEYHLGNT